MNQSRKHRRKVPVLMPVFFILGVGVAFLSAAKAPQPEAAPPPVEEAQAREEYIEQTIKIEAQEQAAIVEQATLVAEPERESLGIFTVYAYCPCTKCCGKWADGITYTGTVATEGRTVGVDPDFVPLGSVIEIDGLGRRVAEDTGAGIDGNTLDVFFDSHDAALEFGVKTLEVWITEE